MRKTTNRLTIYEKAKILGLRAAQLSNNAPPYVEVGELTDCLDIAEKEFEEKKIPFIVRRTLPDGSVEDWSLDELVVYNNDF